MFFLAKEETNFSFVFDYKVFMICFIKIKAYLWLPGLKMPNTQHDLHYVDKNSF